MMLHRCFFVLLSCFLLASPAIGKEWARKMFEESSHDFGVVARGAKAEFEFVLQNIYKEDVHIQSVRSSCGCTTPTILNADLKTWEKGKIRAKFNSRKFLGQKSAVVTVTIDKPYFAEIQLTVKGYIRSDIVMQPGSVDFGDVDAGSNAVRQIAVSYAGRDTWRVTGVEMPNDYLGAELIETRRGGGRVGYQMNVRLKENAPQGALSEQFFLITNDTRMEKIPVVVTGEVLSNVTVSPQSLALGVLAPGQRVTKQILVRSKSPFAVTKVACDGNDCLTFDQPEGQKKMHMIPVTFTAGDEPGKLAMKIKIQTDIGEGAVAQCLATASVRESSSR